MARLHTEATQARNPSEVYEMARDYIAEVTGSDPAGIEPVNSARRS
ncbi:MAG: hypothetical protein ACYCZY_00005 [Lacisediminihabitans sp.]